MHFLLILTMISNGLVIYFYSHPKVQDTKTFSWLLKQLTFFIFTIIIAFPSGPNTLYFDYHTKAPYLEIQ